MGKETLSGWVTLCVQQEIIFPRFIKGSKARKSTPLSAESQHSRKILVYLQFVNIILNMDFVKYERGYYEKEIRDRFRSSGRDD